MSCQNLSLVLNVKKIDALFVDDSLFRLENDKYYYVLIRRIMLTPILLRTNFYFFENIILIEELLVLCLEHACFFVHYN